MSVIYLSSVTRSSKTNAEKLLLLVASIIIIISAVFAFNLKNSLPNNSYVEPVTGDTSHLQNKKQFLELVKQFSDIIVDKNFKPYIDEHYKSQLLKKKKQTENIIEIRGKYIENKDSQNIINANKSLDSIYMERITLFIEINNAYKKYNQTHPDKKDGKGNEKIKPRVIKDKTKKAKETEKISKKDTTDEITVSTNFSDLEKKKKDTTENKN